MQLYTNQLYNNNNHSNKNQIQCLYVLMFGIKYQLIEENKKQAEDMKTSNISLDLIIQMTYNTQKDALSWYNLHSMNEHMIVIRLYYGVTNCNR